MAESDNYVRTDEHGVMRVGVTRVMLDSVIAGFLRGDSPEWIQQQYPALTLEQVYGAVAYYLANREAVDEYLKQQDAVWEKWRAVAAERSGAFLARLRALKAAAAEEMA